MLATANYIASKWIMGSKTDYCTMTIVLNLRLQRFSAGLR